MSTKICTCCGGKFTDPKPHQRLCNECADPTKRKKNRTDLKKLHEDIERKKRPIVHSGMTIGQIATLDRLTHYKLGYGKIQAVYGGYDFEGARAMLRKDGWI